MISRDLFARYVKDALSGFYDPVQLQNHPLARLLLSDHLGTVTAGQRLREVLRQALEALKPDAAVPFGRPEWLGYRLLWLRYVDCLDQDEVCRELGLSRASYYRHHRDAFDAATSILWQQFIHLSASSPDAVLPEQAAGPPGPAVDEAVRLAQAAQRTPVCLASLLEGVQRTIRPWMEQRGIALCVQAPDDAPAIPGDPAMLRQLILNVLTAATEYVAGDTLCLSVSLEDGTALWRIAGIDAARVSPGVLPCEAALAMSRGLLAVYGGELLVETVGRSAAIVLRLPLCSLPTVLVIDDDGDTVALYQRYLQREGYHLWTALCSEEAAQWLAQGTPDVILLDVLMPREDGWDILQQLRTAPKTARTPVIICSVLSQPQLALSLGASAVLQKPVGREELMLAVHRALPREDSAATPRPAAP